jgi:hypothetical protein
LVIYLFIYLFIYLLKFHNYISFFKKNKNRDNTNPTKTVLTIYTPADYTFKESEIPITITTVGAAPGQSVGIPVPSIV